LKNADLFASYNVATSDFDGQGLKLKWRIRNILAVATSDFDGQGLKLASCKVAQL